MADNIMETVAELRRLEAEATMGAWEVHDQHIRSIKDDCQDHIAPIVRTAWVHGQAKDKVPIAYRPDGLTNFSPRFWNEMKREDAALIVAMRNNLSALLDYIERKENTDG